MKTAVVILNWNASELTARCVGAVAGWRELAPDILVVDNGSRDSDALDRLCGTARVIRAGRNLGYGGGNNLGIAAALEGGAEAVLLLNNDATMTERDAALLAAALGSSPRLGVVGPLIRSGSSPGAVVSCGGRDISRRLRTHVPWPAGSRSVAGLAPVEYVPGTAALVRSSALREVGLFDEDYFFSGEMADLCERLKEHGWLCAVMTGALAEHEWSGHGGAADALRAYYEIRNRFLFVRKRRGSRFGLRAFWVGAGLAVATRALLRGDSRRARAVLLGVADGLAGRCGNQNMRVAGIY